MEEVHRVESWGSCEYGDSNPCQIPIPLREAILSTHECWTVRMIPQPPSFRIDWKVFYTIRIDYSTGNSVHSPVPLLFIEAGDRDEILIL